jgi:hypothetical protein
MSGTSHPQPMIEDAGVPWNSGQTSRDPFVALDDLMCVIEGLCPQWPERPTFEGSSTFLL